MPRKQCFVIMPIGDQSFGSNKISASELRKKYDDLIKEAIKIADPTLEVTRADDVSLPGTITTDILTRIMHSDLVIADVTYPNPNVFYELGLRHASRSGTVIIRDKQGPQLPFDISHQRAIEYTNTASGLKDLGGDLKAVFDLFTRNPSATDNHFQELAKLTKYQFPSYANDENVEDEQTALIMEIFKTPDMLKLFSNLPDGEEPDPVETLRAMTKNPKLAESMARMMAKSGHLSFGNTEKKPSAQRSRTRKRRK